MKLTTNSLKELVREVLAEQEPNQDPTKLTSTSMGGASFATSGKDQRKAANPELSNLERGIVQQVDQFLLDLAELPGVELNNKKAIIKRVMGMLQKQIAGSTPQQVAEQCGAPPADALTIDVGGDVDDGESSMAKSQLYRTAEYATQLEQMIEDGEELDAWVQAKITKASDYLSSVKHYLEYRKIQGDH